MKTLRLLITIVPLLVATPAIVTTTGCASYEVAPGSEKWVVETEKALKTAFNVVDGFLLWESQNRGAVGNDVTAAADTLRKHFPAYYRAATATLRVYKYHRTPDNRANLQTVMNTVMEATVQALKFLPSEKANELTTK